MDGADEFRWREAYNSLNLGEVIVGIPHGQEQPILVSGRGVWTLKGIRTKRMDAEEYFDRYYGWYSLSPTMKGTLISRSVMMWSRLLGRNPMMGRLLVCMVIGDERRMLSSTLTGCGYPGTGPCQGGFWTYMLQRIQEGL